MRFQIRFLQLLARMRLFNLGSGRQNFQPCRARRCDKGRFDTEEADKTIIAGSARAIPRWRSFANASELTAIAAKLWQGKCFRGWVSAFTANQSLISAKP
jgi:hypothetical protein